MSESHPRYGTEVYREWNKLRMRRVREDPEYRDREADYSRRWREQNPDRALMQSIRSDARKRLRSAGRSPDATWPL